ncbi:MAG: hypothetical protein GEU94_01005 [Micromonosporaceae bacterium]|nr:hypothetical protein [Micromonosporaceae bacterium]
MTRDPRPRPPAPRLSVRLAPWIRAWRAGLAPYDDVTPAVAGDDDHLCRDFPGTWRDVPLAEGLTVLADVDPDRIRLVLPAPGDPRGLPGPGPFTSAALLAGEGVIAGGLGLTPELEEHRSGSGDVWHTVTWRARPLPDEPPRDSHLPSAAEAEADLSTTLTSATEQLLSLEVARWRPELAQALTSLRRGGTGAELPPGYDPRSRRLYARASVLDQVLSLAAGDPVGGAVTAHEAQQRSHALRPLATACRRALMAACNAPLRG